MSISMGRRVTIAAAVGCSIALLLSGCASTESDSEGTVSTSAAEEQGSASSGEEAAVMNEITPEQVTFAEDLVAQGVDEATAAEQIGAAGYTYRVVMIDGEPLAMTMDYRLDRINLTLENGIVVDATWG